MSALSGSEILPAGTERQTGYCLPAGVEDVSLLVLPHVEQHHRASESIRDKSFRRGLHTPRTRLITIITFLQKKSDN